MKTDKKKKNKKVVNNRKSLKKKVRKTKKTKKRYKGRKVDMEKVYTLINRAQMTKKPQFFSIETVDADTVQNILKDVAVGYIREDMKTKVKFKIWAENDQQLDDIDLDVFSDEIMEDGQLF